LSHGFDVLLLTADINVYIGAVFNLTLEYVSADFVGGMRPHVLRVVVLLGSIED
jgi:hypothetical protein